MLVCSICKQEWSQDGSRLKGVMLGYWERLDDEEGCPFCDGDYEYSNVNVYEQPSHWRWVGM